MPQEIDLDEARELFRQGGVDVIGARAIAIASSSTAVRVFNWRRFRFETEVFDITVVLDDRGGVYRFTQEGWETLPAPPMFKPYANRDKEPAFAEKRSTDMKCPSCGWIHAEKQSCLEAEEDRGRKDAE